MSKPTLFIASSVEGYTVAQAVNTNLDHDIQCTLWPNGTFKLGSNSLADLITKSSAIDFAVFIFTPDDVTTMREKVIATPRDNVVFELGLFIGAIGMDRCYIVKPRGAEMHLPSDILGITVADYAADRSDNDWDSAVAAACSKIKKRVAEQGPLRRVPFVTPGATDKRVANPYNYELGPVELQFLAQCVLGHVNYPGGRSYHWVTREIVAPEHALALAAMKLIRMGYVEKSIDVSDGQEEYFVYDATEDGVEAFMRHEGQYFTLMNPVRKRS